MLNYQHLSLCDPVLPSAGRQNLLRSSSGRLPVAVVLASIGLLSGPTANAQSPATPQVTANFEVASIKVVPDTPGDYHADLGTAVHGEVTLTNATLSQCLRYAFAINNDDQILGPDWIKSRQFRFNIVAKAPPETPVQQLRGMLQSLLTERFKMMLRRDQKDFAFLGLAIGKKGQRIHESRDGTSNSGREIMGTIISNRMQMDQLALLLSRFLHRPVLDMTGLKGPFEVRLEWAPENLQTPSVPEPRADAATAAESVAKPSIFVAVQEQLGLTLEPRKGPLEVIVVDQADKVPIEN
jgi:uncharacterized protein (TIGR03435 family)